MPDAEREPEPGSEHRVTPLELFFDLVMVFAFTQVTRLPGLILPESAQARVGGIAFARSRGASCGSSSSPGVRTSLATRPRASLT